jgi:mannose-1-phosphate guanylyltransferase/mannose-6-phosphate isomerase
MIIPVLLAGGSGTRLWPLSRELHPKQFLRLAGEHSLLEQTFLRLRQLADVGAPLVVAREEHRFLVAEHARRAGVPRASILLEPVGRNTAPAIAIAALEAVRRHGGESLLLVLPSDHVVADDAGFAAAVQAAARAAAVGKLVTFGVAPAQPETGYGYIKVSGKASGSPGAEIAPGVFGLERFVEKPGRDTAARYLAEGGYYWNSGMFLFRADVYLAQLEHFAPDIAAAARAAHAAAQQDSDFLRVDPETFRSCRSDSIDYAVMEKTREAVVVPLDAGWSDLGSWSSVAEIGVPDAEGNLMQGDVLAEDTEGCFIRSEGRLVAALGLRNQVVIETKDAVLVADRSRVQDVKKIVQRLESAQRSETREHRRVYRPWGFYEDLAVGPRYRVKHILINPGARLSLQLHHHRAEHWVVVSGLAKVTCGERQFVLDEDQSTYIPIGEKHRLENPGETPLELIEVQTGSYVGEDDIVRFEDIYGRARK